MSLYLANEGRLFGKFDPAAQDHRKSSTHTQAASDIYFSSHALNYHFAYAEA